MITWLAIKIGIFLFSIYTVEFWKSVVQYLAGKAWDRAVEGMLAVAWAYIIAKVRRKKPPEKIAEQCRPVESLPAPETIVSSPITSRTPPPLPEYPPRRERPKIGVSNNRNQDYIYPRGSVGCINNVKGVRP